MKKWFRKEKVPFSELEECVCLNCNHVFTGRFCPDCGQSVSEFDRPFGFVFYDFLGNFVAFDSRLVKTISSLMFRPGKLTSQFFKGKRASYAPPFRVFIFLSFILFLMLQVTTRRSLTNVLDYSFKDTELVGDSIDIAKLDSIGLDLNVVDITDSSKHVSMDFDFKTIANQENLRMSLLHVAGQLEDRLKKTEDEESRRMLIKLIDICRSPNQLVAKILKYLSWAFFILLPLFALLLKLLYVRRKKNYIRHLVFSVHLHSFMFLLFALIVAINLMFEGAWTLGLLWGLLLVPIYLVLSMKNFYQQNWRKTILKSILVSFVYNLIVFTAFGFVLYNAFSTI